MDWKNYDYAGKTTQELARILETGLDMIHFPPDKRTMHMEAVAHELGQRKADPMAIDALCKGLRKVTCFEINQIEGPREDDDLHLQDYILWRCILDHKDVNTTVALLHMAASGRSDWLRSSAAKALVRRPVDVIVQALNQFMNEVESELAQAMRLHFFNRFTPPTA